MICKNCGRECKATDHYNMGKKIPIYECAVCNEFYCWLGGVLITTFKEVISR